MAPAPLVRWTPELQSYRALSVRQPWAWLILNAGKDVENRRRRMKQPPGTVLLHVGTSKEDFADICQYVRRKFGIEVPEDLERGGIVGLVDIVAIEERHASKWWAKGNYAWVLANPRQLPFRPCKGQLGLFRPEL